MARGAHAAAPDFPFPPGRALAAGLALANGFLLVGNLIHVRAKDSGRTEGRFSDSRWSGNMDGSYSELLSHVLLLVAAAFLVGAWRARRVAAYGVWALVLGVMAADDFLRLHERLGAALVRAAGLPAIAGLRPQDLGELLVWAVPMATLGIVLLIAHVRARGPARRHSWTLIALMALLVGFAVVLDLAAYALDPWLPAAGRALTLLETVGELGVMSLLLIAAYRISRDAAVGEVTLFGLAGSDFAAQSLDQTVRLGPPEVREGGREPLLPARAFRAARQPAGARHHEFRRRRLP